MLALPAMDCNRRERFFRKKDAAKSERCFATRGETEWAGGPMIPSDQKPIHFVITMPAFFAFLGFSIAAIYASIVWYYVCKAH